MHRENSAVTEKRRAVAEKRRAVAEKRRTPKKGGSEIGTALP